VLTASRRAGYKQVAGTPRLRPTSVRSSSTKGYRDRDTETWLNDSGITIVRPAHRNEPAHPGHGLLRAVRQSIEPVNDTFKATRP
jgi:hypothetical protein